MNTLPFDQWLSGYIRWREEAAKLLRLQLSAEVTELIAEKQKLEPMRYDAESWRSDAVGYYYQRKKLELDKLEGIAQTAKHDIAKAQCYKEVWARENSEGVCNAVISRAFKVDSELKRIGVQG